MPVPLLLYLLAFCRITIGLVFAASFLGKARNFASYERTIIGFNIVPRQLARVAAILLLGGELAVLVLISMGDFLLAIGFSLAVALLLIFTGALISVLVRRICTSCNCFGESDKLITPFDILRNVGFILCALVGLWAYSALAGNQHNVHLSLTLPEWGLAAVGAAVFVVIWINLGELAHLFRSARMTPEKGAWDD